MSEPIPAWTYVRLMAHEYLIEVFLAASLAQVPAERSAAFKREILDRPLSLPPTFGPMSLERLQELDQALKADVEEILRKVSSREANIRDIQVQGR